jgi:tetratricopeptide (TPR) repeat protein
MKKLLIGFTIFAVLLLAAGCRKGGETAMDTPETHVAAGHKYLENRQYDAAITAFEKALDLDHRCAAAYSGIGYVKLRQSEDATGETRKGLLEDAEDMFEKAMGLDVDDIYGKIGKARVMIERGDARNARLLAKAAAQEDKGNLQGALWWGIAAGCVGDWDEADYALSRANEIDPTHPEVQAAWDRLSMAKRLMQGVEDQNYRAIAFNYRIGRADAAALFARELDLSRLERRSVTTYGGSAFVGPGEPETGAAEYYATDIAEHWALSEINLCIETGLMEPYPDGSFLPDAKLNRSEFAMLAAKVLSLTTGDPELMTRGMTGESIFKDVRADNFAYGAIVACTSRGILAADADGYFRPLDFITGTDAVNAVRTVETILAHY